jgi:hypothetical protein
MVKPVCLAIRDIEDKRVRERAKQAGRHKNESRRLVEDASVQGCNPTYGPSASPSQTGPVGRRI